MIHELWMDQERLDTLVIAGPLGSDARRLAGAGKQLAWSVDANSHFEAMTEYYVFRNRGAFETSHDWDLTSYDVNGLRTRLDVSFLPPGVQSGAVIDGAEALWPLAEAAHAVTALDDTGNRILGLDVRDYDVDGTFFEISWADVSESDDPPSAAIASLTRSDIPGDWILITWTRQPNPRGGQTYCDWCHSNLRDASVERSVALGLVREYSWACDQCLSAGEYVNTPDGWGGDVWPFA